MIISQKQIDSAISEAVSEFASLFIKVEEQQDLSNLEEYCDTLGYVYDSRAYLDE